jgi:hypothetical protein
MEEQADATEDLIANLRKSHTRQIEIFIKSTTKAMNEMMALIKLENTSPRNNNETSKEGKGKKRDKNA